MTIMVDTQRALTGGVDTHADVHVAAVIDPQGGLLGVESFRTDLAGYKLLTDWMRASERSVWSGWKAPARTEPAWPGIFAEWPRRGRSRPAQRPRAGAPR